MHNQMCLYDQKRLDGAVSPANAHKNMNVCVQRHAYQYYSDCVLCIQALLQALRTERSGAVRRAYATATAHLAAHAPEPRTAKLADTIVELTSEGVLIVCVCVSSLCLRVCVCVCTK